MAGSNTRRTNSNRSGKGSNRGRSNSTSRSRGRSNNNAPLFDEPLFSPDMAVLLSIALGVFLFLCNLGMIGSFGEIVSKAMFGLWGMGAYVFPFAVVAVTFFGYLAKESAAIRRRLIFSIILALLICMFIEECGGTVRDMSVYSVKDIWENGTANRAGGGVLCGSVSYLLNHYLSFAGTVLVLILLMLICIIIILGRQLMGALKDNGREVYSSARESAGERRRQLNEMREREIDESSEIYEEELPRYARKRKGIGVGIGSEKPAYQGEELTEVDRTPRRDKKVSGVMQDTNLKGNKKVSTGRDDMHEITVDDIPEEQTVERAYATAPQPFDDMAEIRIHGMEDLSNRDNKIADEIAAIPEGMDGVTFNAGGADKQTDAYDEPVERPRVKATVDKSTQGMDPISADMTRTMNRAAKKVNKKYKMPTLDLLNKSTSSGGGNSREELMQTAKTLQDTLETFGVRAKVTDISQGPSVTRFELQPEVGVRVNKIVSLADDLKLSLAATDIRIEAPIPGKSAVGIEVPNKSSTAVGLRELLENKEFKNFESKIAFAVGKDIAGKVVVTDIAKMPHMLIAGSTGSGKSVCINTIIMSILYKAHPDDVKLIMVDPKVVELSVYNGIPHLMVPVVTDPKKAAAALHWGVAEMTTRYQKFAEMNVRDLKGYNKAVESKASELDPEVHHKLPQIVIIVDELADLMMVAAKEVEESICRLAQLARACGIHLIIATQRPSVDVITGLIKANMPSRVAFAVSSGVDSRTILDMNGAEKLLGKGDMLFYPQGYPKPARVQGAFVSDSEVSNVVNFLKDQDYGCEGQDELIVKMNSMSSGGTSASAGSEDERDELFALAGMFIIEQGKASIGSLQRKFKIGFNRAARIMDQLCEAGVVGGEEGTKAREILMGPEQFEQYVDDYV